MKHRKKKMISIFAIISIFLLLMGCENKKEETLADKAFEENSKTEDRAKEQEDAQMEETKKEISRNIFKTLPWQVNTLISDVDDVAKDLNNKATTDKELKEGLRSLEKSIKEVELGVKYLPEEFESVGTNLKDLSSNSKTFITEAVKFHQGKGNADEVKKLMSEMLEDIVAIKKVLPLDDKDNGYYSVSWMKEFIQKQ
ncbi:TPA: hypothetical protein ACTZ5S_001152 [Bacillus cereus]|uniref:hypothetical protein n=1 Tax=Bacillus TaxID=1386 RepID=UPI000881A534|nr:MULTISPECIES: hypothetical protein [Bacillus]ASK15750.1 hypothetical protein BA201_18115 [Bacillus cereus]MBL3781848.1 hypothetical protein [Bacillus cereus]MBL3802273.1 hypothetical protein [Bacillus cereus]MBL3813798.1 hypothetical protein [Bacillus cereus]MCU5250881.1 hypothetical protein [Bacillus cereus]